jgi:hypothetical protein
VQERPGSGRRGDATEPQWRRQTLHAKYLQHHLDFRPHPERRRIATEEDYERSSLETVQEGVEFNYSDRTSGDPRVGYFDPLTECFTAVTFDRQWIITHYPTTEDYVRSLPDSNYA